VVEGAGFDAEKQDIAFSKSIVKMEKKQKSKRARAEF